MIFDKLEKRSSASGEEFDWTAWVQGEDSLAVSIRDETYFSCLNILGNTFAKLPINIKQNTEKGEVESEDHYLKELLRLRPNPSMNTFDCIKSLIMLAKHHGISGLFIDRNIITGKVNALYPVRINQITIDNAGLIKSNKENKVLIDFTCIDAQGSCFEKDIIILRDNSMDGINSKATKHYIKNTIDTNLKAQKYQASLFKNGLTNKAVVQMTNDIKDEKEIKKVQDKFNRLYSNDGRIFTVPVGFNVTPLNLSLADSQFSELKILGKKDVSSSIGVPYSLVEKGSLTEEENIAYLSNTIQPLLTALEQEMDWKLLSSVDRQKGYKIRFNVNAMLRTSAETQSVILDRYVRAGIYTLNDAKRILGMPTVEGGDEVTLPSGQISLLDLIQGNATWQKGSKSTKDADSTTKGGDNKNEK